MIKVDEAENIAKRYAETMRVSPFIVDGCELDESEVRPFWQVFLGFIEPFGAEIGLPDSMIVRVDALTGEATHIVSL